MASLRAGVTLTEILVVIAIVLALSAILQPVLQRVKASSHVTECRSNLRQHFVALTLYRQENDGTDVPGTSSAMGLPLSPSVMPTWGGRYTRLTCHGISENMGPGEYMFMWPPVGLVGIDWDEKEFQEEWMDAVTKHGEKTPLIVDASHQESYPVSSYARTRVLTLYLGGIIDWKRGVGLANLRYYDQH